MTACPSRISRVWPFLAASVCSACLFGKNPPPPPPAAPAMTIAAPAEAKVKASMTLSASADANPDASGRPSPVIVRVYQLKTDVGFNSAEFEKLFEDEKQVLGAELISRDEFLLAPAEQRTLDVVLSGETRFVGAIAAFRDIRNAQWRVLLPTPKKALSVAVEKSRIVLSGTE
jgi:type VI secretion system protein VasD